MVIGKADWFRMRKYGGWGITPKTWQGWVYLAVMIIPFIIFQSLPFWNDTTRTYVSAIWLSILFIDIADIMFRLKRDEREQLHEGISDRNAIWAMIIILVGGLLYDAIKYGSNETFYINPFIAGALIAGALVKSITFIYLDKKN